MTGEDEALALALGEGAAAKEQQTDFNVVTVLSKPARRLRERLLKGLPGWGAETEAASGGAGAASEGSASAQLRKFEQLVEEIRANMEGGKATGMARTEGKADGEWSWSGRGGECSVKGAASRSERRGREMAGQGHWLTRASLPCDMWGVGTAEGDDEKDYDSDDEDAGGSTQRVLQPQGEGGKAAKRRRRKRGKRAAAALIAASSPRPAPVDSLKALAQVRVYPAGFRTGP